ncbi:CBP80/20-dependent translation initiation factor-like isoform X2 [Pollicipes pollicipes]|uniref:CBP80/20-dependent translation initiation factor-like isoform X2 n=1 Tax=Pollicipes pollicipes TaxID=41117 RepID=UPI001884B93D|nr:CBP80/20-dependent translation initiation factor-like isoform X2 [Pollicipes pollicipes]
MSGRARGRGRGDFLSGGTDDRRPLRRPGDGLANMPEDWAGLRSPGASITTGNSVESEVQKLSISAEPSEEEIAAMLQSSSNDAQLLATLRELHERALACRAVGARLAAAAGRLQREAPDGSHLRNLRTHMLNFVQSNYKRRHDDRLMSPARFAGAGGLLCEVFRHVRLADGAVVLVLVTPILEYLTALLHCRQEDQVMAAAQLCRVGEELCRCSPEGVAELVNSIRERLISPDCGHALRADFLLCVELAACRWTGLSRHAQHFYAHHGVSLPDLSATQRQSAAPPKAPVGPSEGKRGEDCSVGREPPRSADVSRSGNGRPEAQRQTGVHQWVPLPDEDGWD